MTHIEVISSFAVFLGYELREGRETYLFLRLKREYDKLD